MLMTRSEWIIIVVRTVSICIRPINSPVPLFCITYFTQFAFWRVIMPLLCWSLRTKWSCFFFFFRNWFLWEFMDVNLKKRGSILILYYVIITPSWSRACHCGQPARISDRTCFVPLPYHTNNDDCWCVARLWISLRARPLHALCRSSHFLKRRLACVNWAGRVKHHSGTTY